MSAIERYQITQPQYTDIGPYSVQIFIPITRAQTKLLLFFELQMTEITVKDLLSY